jgi:hypothetical protein
LGVENRAAHGRQETRGRVVSGNPGVSGFHFYFRWIKKLDGYHTKTIIVPAFCLSLFNEMKWGRIRDIDFAV